MTTEQYQHLMNVMLIYFLGIVAFVGLVAFRLSNQIDELDKQPPEIPRKMKF